MPEFLYTARTSDDEPRSGSVESSDVESARRELEQRGLVGIELRTAMAAGGDRGSVTEETLAVRVAEIGHSGLPLSAGLRLLAEETRGRQKRALTALCDRLDAGEPPEEAFERTQGITPPLAAVIRAGCRTGRIGPVLDQYVDRVREREDRRLKIRSSIAYPLVLFSCCLLIVLGLLLFVVPGFRSIFEGFGTELPQLTMALTELSRWLVEYPWVWGSMLAVALVMACVALGGWAPPFVREAFCWIPVVGTAVRAERLASFCDVLGTLVAERVPLPEALRIAAGVAGDPILAGIARDLAVETEQGVGPEEGRAHARLPAGLRSAFLWKEDGDALGESLFAAGRIYDSRARTNADLLSSLIGPITIFVVATTVGTTITALFLPLIKLLNDLS